MATPTAAPATLLRRLSRDAARASRSSSLLGAMVAEARGSPRAPEAVTGLGPGSGSPRRLRPAPPPLWAPASVVPFPKPSVKAEVPPLVGPGTAPDSSESVVLYYPLVQSNVPRRLKSVASRTAGFLQI